MRLVIAFLVLVLSGCSKEDADFHSMEGLWESEATKARFRVDSDGECRYFPGNQKSGGMICTLKTLGESTARVTFKKENVFVEGELKIVGNRLFFSVPSGGGDIFKLSQ